MVNDGLCGPSAYALASEGTRDLPQKPCVKRSFGWTLRVRTIGPSAYRNETLRVR